MTHLVHIVFLLFGESQNVIGLISKLHVLLVINAGHSDLTWSDIYGQIRG